MFRTDDAGRLTPDAVTYQCCGFVLNDFTGFNQVMAVTFWHYSTPILDGIFTNL